MMNQRGEGEIAIISLVTILGILLIGGCMVGYPHYQVYQQRLEGEAILEKQKSEKQVAVQSALAKKESAQMLAEAEVMRAEGVAKANKIIGDSSSVRRRRFLYLYNTGRRAGHGGGVAGVH